MMCIPASIQDERPFIAAGYGPQAVLSRRHLLPGEARWRAQLDNGRAVCASSPCRAVLHDAIVAEQHAAARNGAVVCDCHDSLVDGLRYGSVLTRRWLLRMHGGAAEEQRGGHREQS